MTDPKTINPCAGCVVIWDWDDHRNNGKIGGTDYRVFPAKGFVLVAAATGTVVRLSSTELRLQVTATLRYNYRELGSILHTGHVEIGQPIATSGRPYPGGAAFYGPHMDAEVLQNGRWIRERFEPHVNSSLAPAGESGEVITPDEPLATIYRKATMSITRHFRDDVGEFIMYASPAGVRLSRELSTATLADRTFEVGVAQALRVLDDLPPALPFYDDTPNGGWYMLTQLASTVAGMPAGYPLATDNPFIPARFYGGTGGDNTAVLAALAALDAQADTYQAQALAAIANMDDEFLASVGLKRA